MADAFLFLFIVFVNFADLFDFALSVKNHSFILAAMRRAVGQGLTSLQALKLEGCRLVNSHALDVPPPRLEAQPAQLADIFALCPDGMALLDAQGRVLFANAACQALWGWGAGPREPDGWTALDAQWAMSCRPAQTPGAEQSLARQRQAVCSDPAQANNPVVMHLLHPQPRVVHRHMRVCGPDQSQTALYFRDVTREFEVDRMKTEFLSTAAHELRTPMASIYGFSELLLGRTLPPEQLHEAIGIIHRQSALLVDLINELLDLARIEARAGQDFRLQSTALQPLLDETIAALSVQHGGRAVQCDVRHGQSLVTLDRRKTRLALTNVLSNAFKYSPQGGAVVLSTLTRDRAGQTQLGVRVRDEGMGMSVEQLARLFERFYRADPLGDIPGTGLGLSLVKEIMSLQGGDIEVSSTLGQGTEVTLWFALPTEGHPCPPPQRVL